MNCTFFVDIVFPHGIVLNLANHSTLIWEDNDHLLLPATRRKNASAQHEEFTEKKVPDNISMAAKIVTK